MTRSSNNPSGVYSYAVHPRSSGRPPLSADEIERVRADAPDDPVRLPDGWLACRTCGVAVQRTSDLSTEIHLKAMGRAVEDPVAAMTAAAQNQQPIPLVFGLCADHLRTQELAEQLLDSSNHPVYRDRMACALDALSFLAPQTVEHMIGLDLEGLSTLVQHLGYLGSTARWVSRFVPVIAPEADPRTCAPRPFAHLMPGKRADLRQAYALLLKERVARSAPPAKIPPPQVFNPAFSIPIPGGCLMCGIGTQEVSATLLAQQGRESIARQIWTAKRTGTQQLGGRPSAQWLAGYLCQVCAAAVEHVHAMGPTALERALVAALLPSGIGGSSVGVSTR